MAWLLIYQEWQRLLDWLFVILPNLRTCNIYCLHHTKNVWQYPILIKATHLIKNFRATQFTWLTLVWPRSSERHVTRPAIFPTEKTSSLRARLATAASELTLESVNNKQSRFPLCILSCRTLQTRRYGGSWLHSYIFFDWVTSLAKNPRMLKINENWTYLRKKGIGVCCGSLRWDSVRICCLYELCQVIGKTHVKYKAECTILILFIFFPFLDQSF